MDAGHLSSQGVEEVEVWEQKLWIEAEPMVSDHLALSRALCWAVKVQGVVRTSTKGRSDAGRVLYQNRRLRGQLATSQATLL